MERKIKVIEVFPDSKKSKEEKKEEAVKAVTAALRIVSKKAI